MLEKLIESQLLLPLIAVGALVQAVVFFKVGWSLKSMGARRRETTLQKDIRDAKTSVPQLESTIRSREQLVARLQDEFQTQQERSAQLLSEQAQRERLLKTAQNEIRHLTHELSAIKGKSISSHESDFELSDDAVGMPSATSSPLVEKLKATEKLYEKMKAAVIERSVRVEELERQLGDGEGGIGSGEQGMLSNAEIDALHRQLDQRNRSISELNAQVAQLKQEKDMVEELAQKRSKANRTLKDSKSDVEARKLELEQEVETHHKTISDRELSIHRLLSEVQVVRKNLRDSVEEAHQLKRTNEVKDKALAEALEIQQSLEQAISQRETKLIALQSELDKAEAAVILLQRELADLTRQPEDSLVTPRDSLATELEARHRAHQEKDVADEQASSLTERFTAAESLNPRRVAGDRTDS